MIHLNERLCYPFGATLVARILGTSTEIKWKTERRDCKGIRLKINSTRIPLQEID